MNLSNLTHRDLVEITRLVKRRSQLMAEVAKLDRQLAGYEGGGGATRPAAPTAKAGRKRGYRRKAKQEIIELLKSAGSEGITVREIADKFGVNVNRIFNWFYATGKKLKNIKKVGEARYRWVE